MSCSQCCNEILQTAAKSESFGEDVGVTSGCPPGSNYDRSPTKLWKHHKPHSATINNRTVSHYIEFHSGALNGNNGVSEVSVYVRELSSSHARVFVFRAVHAVRMDVCCLLYLDVSEEMQVALHLPACELKIVFLLPTVMLIGREALMELGIKRERWLMTPWKTAITFKFIYLFGRGFCPERHYK